MSNLRTFIKALIEQTNDVTIYSFLDEHSPMYYNTSEILKECEDLSEGIDLVNENMELAYFSQDLGEVNGAAWVEVNENYFNFFVATTEEAPDVVFEELVRNCIEEYEFLKHYNKNLKLEIKVEDIETEQCFESKFGLKTIRSYPGLCIMG